MSKIFPKQQPLIPHGKVILGGLALVVLFFLIPGCGDSPEKYMKDTIAWTNEMADVLESIDSKESARAAQPRLDELKRKSEELEERADKLKLKDLSSEQRKALDEKFQQEMRKAQDRKAAALDKTAPLMYKLITGENEKK
jgi:hypothetical protein